MYLKEVLGLGDFRLQAFETIQKWFAVVNLAINYLQYTAMLAYRPQHALPSLAECKRQHQQAHLDTLLRRLVTEIKKKPQKVEAILQAYLPMYAAGT